MKINSAVVLCELLLIIVACGSARATAQPAYYKVTGSLTEYLNVRQEPNRESTDIGNLKPDAQPFEILEVDPSGQWGQIAWQETTGWVALEYMEPIELPHLENTIVPIGLLCAGTEPFWTIEIESSEGALFSTQETTTPMTLSNVKVSRNQSELPVAIELLAGDYTALTVLKRQACSDGMTDIRYSWAADVVMQPDLSLLSGCCLLR